MINHGSAAAPEVCRGGRGGGAVPLGPARFRTGLMPGAGASVSAAGSAGLECGWQVRAEALFEEGAKAIQYGGEEGFLAS